MLDTLKYHQLPQRERWLTTLKDALAETGRSEPWRHALLPFLAEQLGQEFWPTLRTMSLHAPSPALREIAWRERLRCLQRGCEVDRNALKAAYQREHGKEARDLIIEIASQRFPALVHRWCGVRWWALDTARGCERAFLQLGDLIAFKRLMQWIKVLFTESESNGQGEHLLVSTLTQLIPLVHGKRRVVQYGELLLSFFQPRRNLESGLAVLAPLSTLPERRETARLAQKLLAQALKAPQHPSLIRAIRQLSHRLQSER